jgi:hypothetical protein
MCSSAGQGLLILGYLLLVDAPGVMPGATAARWLRLQLPAVFGGTLQVRMQQRLERASMRSQSPRPP